MSSFKIECPSCEAKVLIKNPDLVGTKVECPKCKYRFKVEAPKDAPPPDTTKAAKKEAKPAAAAAPEKKKTGAKKSNKKLVGVVLGVAAVALLGIGGFVLFGGGDDDKPVGSGGGGGYTGGGGYVAGGGGEQGPDEGEKKQDDQTKPKAPPLARSDKDATNLLPGQSVAVYRLDVGRLRLSPVGGPLFDQAMSDLFRTSMGFDPSEVDQYYHCVVGEKDRDPFGLIRLREPMAEKDVTGKLAGLGPAKSVNGKTLHSIKDNPFLSAAGNAFSSRSLLANAYTTPPPGAAPAKVKPLGACVYDTQTILIGDHGVLDKFLTGLNEGGYPEFQTVLKKEAPPPPPPPTEGEPMGTATTDPVMSPDGNPMSAEAAAPKKVPTPQPTNKDYTTNPSYLSVAPELKRLLNAMEEDAGGQPILVIAEKFDAAVFDRKNVKEEYEPIAKVVGPVLDRTQYVGANLTTFTNRQVAGTVRLIGKTEEDARRIALDHLSPGLVEAVPVLSLLLSTPIELRNFANPNQGIPGGAEYPGGLFIGTAGYGSGNPSGYGGSAYGPPPGGGGSAYGPPPGYAGSRSGPPMGGGSGYGPPPGYAGSRSGPPPGPGGSTYGPPPGYAGSGSGPPGRPGAYGGQPSGPGMAPPGMIEPYTPPGMGEPGMGEPGMGEPGVTSPTRQNTTPSHVDLRITDQVVTISVDVTISDATYGTVLAPRIFGFVNQLKGKAAVFAGNYTWHRLAKAVTRYVEEHKQFPRGTADRPATDASRLLGLPYPPGTRVSFFAELLPYLGREGISRGINQGMAWFDVRNVAATESWVPELLVSYYPQSAWRSHTPLAPEHTFGGTNYVAVAGVGLDAARFKPDNSEHQKLIGISGYDWGSKVEEVTDGLANTIYLLQTPPGFSRPWAAGGGATVVGLDPAAPMDDFKHQRPDGKWGTYAIMGDGTVRWIPADIDPKIFLAMATRSGGEKLPELDAVAPQVDPPGRKAELKATAPPTGAAPADDGAKPTLAPAPREK